MWKKAICAFLCFLLCSTFPYQALSKSVRQVEVDEGQVVPINTALGYSTVVEFHSKPLNAVLGDQDAFKLEYIGNSITLKPLLPRAKSNLFIFTDYDRYNCALRTVDPSEVDYIVKLSTRSKAYPIQVEGQTTVTRPKESTSSATESAKVKPIHKKSSWKGFALNVISVLEVKGQGSDSQGDPTAIVYEIELSSKHVAYLFSGGSLGVKQGKVFLPIESLYLDKTQICPGCLPVRGKLVVLKRDYRGHLPVSLLFAVPGHVLQVVMAQSSVPVTASKGVSQVKKGR